MLRGTPISTMPVPGWRSTHFCPPTQFLHSAGPNPNQLSGANAVHANRAWAASCSGGRQPQKLQYLGSLIPRMRSPVSESFNFGASGQTARPHHSHTYTMFTYMRHTSCSSGYLLSQAWTEAEPVPSNALLCPPGSDALQRPPAAQACVSRQAGSH